MSMFTAEGLTYLGAIALIDALKRVDIDANISTGGVAISVKPDRVNQAKEVCLKHGAIFSPGYSRLEEATLLRGGDLEEVERAKNNAIAVIQEWRNSE